MLNIVASPLLDPVRRGVLDLSADELRAWLEAHDQPPMRDRQLRQWILQRGAQDFADMTDLPRLLREQLAESFLPLETRVARHLQAADGTHKLLLRLRDDRLIECVLIQEDSRRTACISTQVGCGMGCVFCASGLDGVDRNLTAGEILEQLVRLRNCDALVSGGVVSGEWSKAHNDPAVPTTHHSPLTTHQPRLSHIVVMGMGEPLANL